MEDEILIEIGRAVLPVLDRLGMLKENLIRDASIAKEYNDMKKEGYSCREARRLLSEKYFTSEKNIERLLYVKSAGNKINDN